MACQWICPGYFSIYRLTFASHRILLLHFLIQNVSQLPRVVSIPLLLYLTPTQVPSVVRIVLGLQLLSEASPCLQALDIGRMRTRFLLWLIWTTSQL